MNKTIYVLELEYNKYFLEDKDKAVEIWKLLSDSNLQKLCKVNEFGTEDRDPCYYPGFIVPELKAMKVELCQNRQEAVRAFENFKKLRKLKIIKDKDDSRK